MISFGSAVKFVASGLLFINRQSFIKYFFFSALDFFLLLKIDFTHIIYSEYG